MRLNKFLSNSGVASRRKCDEIILSGKVAVNGKVVTELGINVNEKKDVPILVGITTDLSNIKPGNRLVEEDLMKLNKLENQRLKIDLKQFNLSESITNQILNYETLIENKNIELECNIEEDINIISEETYLEIIWSNLISNAIKFTDNNGKIFISLIKLNNEIIFKIKDTGCGIDSETGKNIFEKFYQGDTSHSKEGNGLGLALVKKVIDILGGQIKVESEKGIGTTFTVKLKGDNNGR